LIKTDVDLSSWQNRAETATVKLHHMASAVYSIQRQNPSSLAKILIAWDRFAKGVLHQPHQMLAIRFNYVTADEPLKPHLSKFYNFPGIMICALDRDHLWATSRT